MRPVPVAVVMLIGLTLATSIQADHGCNGTIVQIDAGSQTFYLDDRNTPSSQGGRWLYWETNGIESLQSGDTIDLLQEAYEPAIPDTCWHPGEPDTLVVAFP